MVVERSNASVYLIIDTLELKVEGSIPGIAVPFLGRQFSEKNSRINSRVRMRSTSTARARTHARAHAHTQPRFSEQEREFDLLGGLRHTASYE